MGEEGIKMSLGVCVKYLCVVGVKKMGENV
jgi:hypothetical protein